MPAITRMNSLHTSICIVERIRELVRLVGAEEGGVD